jgi:hypothetical protein
VEPEIVAALAIEAREKMKLRHVPLFIVREMARRRDHKKLVAATLERVIQRPDELAEFVALYWKEKRQPLSAQAKKGLAKAFNKFDAYQLGKYDRDNPVKLRDVLFLCHAKPKDAEQEELWKKLVDGTLESPDTWEVALSAGKDRKETWERLIAENRLGALALLRNLRNIKEAGIESSVILGALKAMKAERVLPFRFISAARFAPQWEPQLEEAMFKCLDGLEKISGRTVLLVDVSGSMDSGKVSRKSDITAMDAACGIAMLAREMCEDAVVYTFSDKLVQVPARRGFALRDAIVGSQPHSGTYIGESLKALREKYDRIIVFTDEQSHDRVPDPVGKGYVINVATNRNGVGYGRWLHIDGFSEAALDFIRGLEKESESLK